jgi:hypothetical protein
MSQVLRRIVALTLTLSRRERELNSCLRQVVRFLVFLPEGDWNQRLPSAKTVALPPLSPGEGWGEGNA